MKKFSIWSDTYFWDRNAMEDYEEETRAFLMEDGIAATALLDFPKRWTNLTQELKIHTLRNLSANLQIIAAI